MGYLRSHGHHHRRQSQSCIRQEVLELMFVRMVGHQIELRPAG